MAFLRALISLLLGGPPDAASEARLASRWSPPMSPPTMASRTPPLWPGSSGDPYKSMPIEAAFASLLSWFNYYNWLAGLL